MTNVIDVAKKCFRDEAEAILNLIPKLDEDFTRAIELIIESKGKLIVTGVGKSGHIGAKIASTMASTGTPAFFVNPLDAFHGDLGMICEGDVVIAISNSGKASRYSVFKTIFPFSIFIPRFFALISFRSSFLFSA